MCVPRFLWLPSRAALSRCAAALAASLLAAGGAARAADAEPGAWTFRARAVLSGSSTHSEPAGYKVYSGVALEAAVARALGPLFSLELAARTESREVDVNRGTAQDTRLGSLELLPLALVLDVRPWSGEVLRPYAGAGLALALFWEKSGALDDTQASPGFGPLARVGLDLALSPSFALNLEVRWNLLRTDVDQAGARLATLRIDPLTLAAGLALRL